MHAFLFINPTSNTLQEKINELQALKLDFNLSKISDVRELNNFTRLKVTEISAILIRDFDKAGEEAQNAFLKSLEETQENLFYLLTASNTNNILPTILSRCEVIETNSKIETTDTEKSKAKEFLNADIGEKLTIISKITKREEGIEFIKNLIIASHQTFLENPDMANLLDSANKTLRNLEANGNVALQLTNFVVNSA